MTQTVDTMSAAKAYQKIIETAGGDPDRAERALETRLTRSPSFSQVVEEHLHRLVSVTPYTVATYRGYVRNHCQGFAGMAVNSISEDDLLDWIRSMQAAGKSVKTIRNVHGLISAVFDTAVRKHYRQDNPCDSELLPRETNHSEATTFLTMPEFRHVLSHVEPEYQPVFTFLVATGLRFGEALALTESACDLESPVPTVRVTKAWKFSGTSHDYYLGEPKTRKAVRSVAIPPSIVELLKAQIEATSNEFIFAPDGYDLPGYDRLAQRWRRAVTLARAEGLKKSPRLHDLRHTHASLMIAQGMNLYELASRLGHESITTTTSTYAHLVPDAHFRAIEYTEKALGM